MSMQNNSPKKCNKRPENRITPFTISKPEKLITPFTFDKNKLLNEKSAGEEKGKSVKTDFSEYVTEGVIVKPFEFVPEDIIKASGEICSKLEPMLGESTKSFVPHLCSALHEYKKSGHEIAYIPAEISKEKSKKLFNFSLTLLKKIVNIFDTENGEKKEISYFIGIELFLKNGDIKKYESVVKSDKIKSFSWVNRATNGFAEEPTDKNEMICYKKMVQQCLESANVPTELIYPNAGWRLIPDIGWRYIYGTGAVCVDGDNIHTRNRNENFLFPSGKINQSIIFAKAIEMCRICKSGYASTILFLFTHAATMQTFFQESGFSINFVLGVVGVTNSRKTSLALEMCKIFDGNKKRADAEFTATAAGIEKTLSKYKDAAILIDDFRPGETRTEQIDLNKRLQSLIRFYGNRIPKKRMDDYSGQEKKFFAIQGVCVLTMEVVTGVLSSLSRMMIAEIDKNEVLNETLLYYQQNPWILSSHLFDFIQWETQFQDFILSTISDKMPHLRTQYKFDFQRFGEMYAVFHITAQFIGSYAQNRGFWDTENSAEFIQQCDCIIITLLRNMEKRLKHSDKGIVVANAIVQAIRDGILSPVELNEKTCCKKELAYEDATRIFVQTKIIRKISDDYCFKYKIDSFFVNDEEVITALERLEILDILEKESSKERSRKLPIQHGNHLRYLYLRKKNLFETTMEN